MDYEVSHFFHDRERPGESNNNWEAGDTSDNFAQVFP
jgi:hypothetical protein